MNYHWANLKSDLYRITGLNLFNSKELDVAMDSNEKRDESDKDVNDAAVVSLFDHIKARYAPKAEIPEELVAQLKENKNLVDEFYSAFGDEWMPESLETWVFFSLYVLRMPEHRNRRFDHILDLRYLTPFYPRFRLLALQKRQDMTTTAVKFREGLMFFYQCCFGYDNFLPYADPSYIKPTIESDSHCPEIAFDLFEDKDQREPTGVFIKEHHTWEEVGRQMTGMAFKTNSPIANRLKKIKNIERLFSFMDADQNNWLVTGPVIFARVQCDSPSQPLLQPFKTKFKNVGFVSATDPQKYKSTRWFRAVIDTVAAKSGAASVVVNSSGKAEFIVRGYGVTFPPKNEKCAGCPKCETKGKSD